MAQNSPGWAGGYVTEVEYTSSYFHELSPSHLNFAAVIAGVTPIPLDRPFHYCELACGQGLTTLVLAAANPQGQFVGIDFNPVQINRARQLAAEAGLTNLRFIDAAFLEMEALDLPTFDFITLHGIWSWISPENQEALVTFLGKRLRVGGLVYVSYNSLPGWAAAAPLRELLFDLADQASGSIFQRFSTAAEQARAMAEKNAIYFTANPNLRNRLDGLKAMSPHYLVHEYLNQEWRPLYHRDVAGSMSAARLTYVGSATIQEQLPDLSLPQAAREMLNAMPPGPRRETLKDYWLNTQFRRDIFSRGAIPLTQAEQSRIALATRYCLRVPAARCQLKVKLPLGEVELREAIYRPILERLGRGPATLQDIVNDAGGQVKPAELVAAIGVLIAVNYVFAAVSAEQEQAARIGSATLNRVLLRRVTEGRGVSVLAAAAVGSGVTPDGGDLLMLGMAQAGHADPAQASFQALKSGGRKVIKDGRELDNDQEGLAELQRLYSVMVEERLPLLRAQGVAGV